MACKACRVTKDAFLVGVLPLLVFRVFIYKEGLVRFCTAPYKKPTSKNLACAYMHLTNYAVNKHNAEAFVTPGSNPASLRAGRVVTDSTDDASAGGRGGGGGQHSSQGSTQQLAGTGDSASKWSFVQLRHYLESHGGAVHGTS